MGSVQKLATVVMVGLVGLATLMVVYLANEPNRRDAEAEEQEEAAIERGIDSFVQYCVVCHGPAGEGTSMGEPGRIGFPLGGDTPAGQNATALNQTGVNAEGTPYANDLFGVGVAGRANYLRNVITNGRGNMPYWGGPNGQLNEEQIDELVIMIQHVDWDRVYNHAVEAAGGYPTPNPPPEATAAPPPTGGEPQPGAPQTVELIDTNFVPKEFTVTAGQPATVTLTNTGAIEHTFTIDALGIDEVLQPGESRDIQITAQPGEYEYYCAIPGHKEAGMVGRLIVTEGAPPAQPPLAETPAAGAPPAAPQTVELVDIDFVPEQLTIPAGQPATVTLTNTGALEHTFTIDALGIDEVLQPGDSRDITITAQAGTYEYYCAIPGHKEGGMVGTLTVQ